jgi:hypothetical protein
MEAVRRVDQSYVDVAMTIGDWKALSEFYTGCRQKPTLTERQRHMDDIIKLACSGLGEDRHIFNLIALHCAGRIAVIHYRPEDDIEEPWTKRRRTDDNDNDSGEELGDDDTDDDE